MDLVKNFLVRYSAIIRALVSVLALLTVHILVLREALLGPLSALADSVFYSDLVFDLVWSGLIATIIGRLVSLFAFTGAVQDQLSISSSLIDLLLRVARYDSDRKISIVAGANSWIEKRIQGLEFFVSAVAFAILYFGSQIFSPALPLYLAALLGVKIFAFQVLLHIRVTSIADAKRNLLSSDTPKIAILVSLLSLLLFLVSISTAILRAHEISGRNIVSLRLIEPEAAECVSILGKNSNGVFFERVFSEDAEMGRVFFIPTDRIEAMVEIGGSEFFWQRAPEELGCGIGDVFWR